MPDLSDKGPKETKGDMTNPDERGRLGKFRVSESDLDTGVMPSSMEEMQNDPLHAKTYRRGGKAKDRRTLSNN